MEIARTAREMIAGMSPALRPGRFVFVTTAPDRAASLLPDAVAMFREAEGVSLVLPVEVAARHGFETAGAMRCITLNVYSALEGVGLTAAVTGALAERGIACNVIAAFHHDHVFVPEADCDVALNALKALQKSV